MKKRTVLLQCLILILLLSSCWDQRLLKDHKLILSIGYDLGKEDEIIKSVTFPQEVIGDPQQIASSEKSEVITTIGDTVKDAENKMDQYIPNKFDRSKAEVILFGKKLAKEGIYSTLDSLYRDLRGPLNASLAIIDGTAEEALNVKQTYNLLTSGFYSKLIRSADESGIIKSENIQTISPNILSEGEDICLPYIIMKKGGDIVEIKGLALFSDDVMTGTLDLEESSMLLILTNQAPKRTKINLQVTENKKENDKNFVDISIRKLKRKVNITTDNDDVKAEIKIKINVEIDEYSEDHLESDLKAKKLTKQIEERLTELASNTIEKIQKANNDSLKIGQKVKAHHYSTWEKIDWKEVYPDIPIDVNFDIKIIRHGIIN